MKRARLEKEKKEKKSLNFKPKINENSRQMVENRITQVSMKSASNLRNANSTQPISGFDLNSTGGFQNAQEPANAVAVNPIHKKGATETWSSLRDLPK